MVEKIKYFDNKNGYGFIKYKTSGDILVNFGTKNKAVIENLNLAEHVEFYLIRIDDGYKVSYINIKPNIKVQKNVIKEKIEIAAAIITILGFILGTIDDKTPKIENNININCDNCKIEIIQQCDNKKEPKN